MHGSPWLQGWVHATCGLNLAAVYCNHSKNGDKVSLFPELDFTQARTYGLIGHSLSDFTWILSPLIDGGRRRFQSHRSSSVSCSKKWDRRRREKQRERGRERGVILYLCFPRNWRWRRSNFPGGNHSVPFWMGCLSEYHSGRVRPKQGFGIIFCRTFEQNILPKPNTWKLALFGG